VYVWPCALALVDLNAQVILAAAEKDQLMECMVTLAPGAFDGRVRHCLLIVNQFTLNPKP
jgi:hypothetical protein